MLVDEELEEYTASEEVAVELEQEVVALVADEDEDVVGGTSAREGALYECVADVARLVDAVVDGFVAVDEGLFDVSVHEEVETE